ncbi:hypothetical protein DMENIID0001_132170 [Sergentomyia squamirostris]
MREHEQGESLRCPRCRKSYASERTLRKHIENHPDSHTCPICSKQFYHKQGVKVHMITHSQERPFECEICKLRYKSKSTVRTHMFVHQHEKPFACSNCPKTFVSAFKLRFHKKISQECDTPVKCTDYTEHSLKTHTHNTHETKEELKTPFECHFCGIVFKYRSSIQVHMKTHNKEINQAHKVSD